MLGISPLPGALRPEELLEEGWAVVVMAERGFVFSGTSG